MNNKFIKPAVLVLLFLAGTTRMLIGQNSKKVELIEWTSNACDNTHDPYRLVNRISHLEVVGDVTYITVSFTDNCCAKFNPVIEYKKNVLTLKPYDKLEGEYCLCDCCFSIEYRIQGVAGRDYVVHFKDKMIVRSDEPYPVSEPTSEQYQGKTINLTNKYGFKQGIWMTFHKNGAVESISQYPEHSLDSESMPIWEKEFYPSGKLFRHIRNDTLQSWFEDGALRTENIDYAVGDTTYRREFALEHHSRRLMNRLLTKTYPFTYTSNLDQHYKSRRTSRLETIYHEEYFEGGQSKLLVRNDTTWKWYDNGMLASVDTDTRSFEYSTDGSLSEIGYQWASKGPTYFGDINHYLSINFFPGGNVRIARYSRPEPEDDGSVALGVSYEWSWNSEGKLISSPDNWSNEKLPWKRFPELTIPE